MYRIRDLLAIGLHRRPAQAISAMRGIDAPLRPLRNARAGSIARTDEGRRRRHRGVFAQLGAARRGRRPGARRLSQAARGRPQVPTNSPIEVDRGGQDARPGRRILAGRPAAHRRAADPAGQGLSRTMGRRRRSGWPAKQAAPVAAPECRRQALRRSGMVLEPVLRFPQAGLSAHRALGQQTGHRCRPTRSAHQAEGRILHAADRQCAVADEFRADQSRTAARDAHQQRRQSGPRHAHAGRGHRDRRRRSEDPPVRFLDVRGRPQSRDDARQGDFPERADAAHPIRAVDRRPCSSGRC